MRSWRTRFPPGLMDHQGKRWPHSSISRRVDSNGAVPVEGGLWRLSCVLLRKPSVRDRLDGRPCLQVSLSGTSPTVWPFTVYDCTLPLQIPHSHDDTGWQRNVPVLRGGGSVHLRYGGIVATREQCPPVHLRGNGLLHAVSPTYPRLFASLPNLTHKCPRLRVGTDWRLASGGGWEMGVLAAR